MKLIRILFCICFITLLSFTRVYSQTYFKFIDYGKTWEVLHMSYQEICGLGSADRYFFDRDTIINSIQYFILSSNPIVNILPGPLCDPLAVDTTIKYDVAILREDTIAKKVYTHESWGDSLLWDFDLSLGSPIVGYYSASNPNYYVVDSIGSITLANGSARQVYYTTGVGNGLEYVMEGYGGGRGPLSWLGIGLGFEDFCVCYRENGTPVWPDSITNTSAIVPNCFDDWGSSYWNIQGKTYTDINGNCVQNTGEPNRTYLKVLLYNGATLEQQTYSNNFGRYAFQAGSGMYDLKIDTTNLALEVVCPQNGINNVVLTPLDSTENGVNFALECKSGFDVGIQSIFRYLGGIKPGNIASVRLFGGDMTAPYGFECATGISGSITIDISGPATYVSPIAGTLTPIVNGSQLTYTISDYSSLDFYNKIGLNFRVDSLAQIGDTICFSTTATPLAGDLNTSNNYKLQCYSVVNSLDPNEKEVFPFGSVSPDNEWLTYTIYFQNTGNAPASVIYISDTLDTNVDIASFQLLAFSHTPETKIEGDLLTFRFLNIELPDSTTNEPDSHGFVQYRVKQLPMLPQGTQITNTAHIYFDLNAAVVTNTTVNVVDTMLLNVHDVESKTVNIYPIPATEILTINGLGAINSNKITVLDITGRILIELNNTNQQYKVDVDVSGLSNGIYFIKVEDRLLKFVKI